MAAVEQLLRRRSVGAWFLDHLDNPLDAKLPLFPPNVEAGSGNCDVFDTRSSPRVDSDSYVPDLRDIARNR